MAILIDSGATHSFAYTSRDVIFMFLQITVKAFPLDIVSLFFTSLPRNISFYLQISSNCSWRLDLYAFRDLYLPSDASFSSAKIIFIFLFLQIPSEMISFKEISTFQQKASNSFRRDNLFSCILY